MWGRRGWDVDDDCVGCWIRGVVFDVGVCGGNRGEGAMVVERSCCGVGSRVVTWGRETCNERESEEEGHGVVEGSEVVGFEVVGYEVVGWECEYVLGVCIVVVYEGGFEGSWNCFRSG